jgi:hypothetical protein
MATRFLSAAGRGRETELQARCLMVALLFRFIRLLISILYDVDWSSQRWLKSVGIGAAIGVLIPLAMAVYFIFRA